MAREWRKSPTTVNVEKLQTYKNSESRPNYRIICDVVNDNIFLYMQMIQVADAQQLLQMSLAKPNFLREIRSTRADGNLQPTTKQQNLLSQEQPLLTQTQAPEIIHQPIYRVR